LMVTMESSPSSSPSILRLKCVKLHCQSPATAIVFDFVQNLPVPNVTANKIFYRRQVWYRIFGIVLEHVGSYVHIPWGRRNTWTEWSHINAAALS
jgi:hypothetical protein